MNDNLLTCHKAVGAPLISVVMPVYNGEKFIGEAIDSILAQTFTDFELLIIDDGSTDNSLDVLNKYSKLDDRIRLVARENRNLATTLNDLIDLARGEWIARMDQDDIALPQRLGRQLEWLDQTGADICGSWVEFFGTNDHRIMRHPETDEALKIELLFDAPFAHPTVMMRTALIKLLRYDKAWEKAEDYDLWERAARAGWRMTNVQEVLLLCRQHPAQITKHNFDQNLILSQMIRRRCWDFVAEDNSLEADWIDEILKLRDPTSTSIDIEKVNAAISNLLQRVGDEAGQTIIHHLSRFYIKVAGSCPGLLSSWNKLSSSYSTQIVTSTKWKLLILSKFRIKPDSKVFKSLRKFYFFVFKFNETV